MESLSTDSYYGDRTIKQEQSLTLYQDGSSYGEGKVQEVEGGKTSKEDSFQRRSLVRTDNIRTDENSIIDFDMFYHVIDYRNDVFTQESYSDYVNRFFIFDTDEEASAAGADSESYLLASDTALAATFQHVGTLYTFISGSLLNSAYVQQTGLDSMTITHTEEGYSYHAEADYQLDGDINNVTNYHVEATFLVDEDKEKLLSYETISTSEDVSLTDPDDTYLSGTKTNGSLEYGNRSAVPQEDPLPVLDYFLQNVEEAALLDSSREEIDPENVSREASFLFALPKVYTPSKAIINAEWELVPNSSSNPDAVLCDDGYFEVVGGGKTTLTFAYFGLTGDVWENKFYTIDVNVLDNDPIESISLSTTDLPIGNLLTVGTAYDISVYVRPSTANPAFTIENSNPDAIEASLSPDGDLRLVAQKEGESTITIRSEENPEVSDSITVKAYNALSTSETESYLAGKSFLYDRSVYGYNQRMVFDQEGDGGQVIETNLDTGAQTSYPFTFKVRNMDILLTWTEESLDYTEGYLAVDGSFLSFYREEAYVDAIFNLEESL